MRRFLALPISLLLAIWATGTVAAVWPPGTVTVDTDGCSFTVHIDLDEQPAIIGWEIREFNASWMDGSVILSGSGKPDAEGRLTVGPLEAAEGHYNAIVDDETPVDSSAQVVDFTLSCPASPAPPTPAPPTPAPPTPTPAGEEHPAQGTPPPTGEELAAVGVGANVTPPPTDTGAATTSRSDDGPRAALLGLTGLIAGGLFLARAAKPGMIRVRTGRSRR